MSVWIIGNGASLKETPLYLLKDAITFASNRIHLHYPFTSWRPTVYFRHEIDDRDWRDVAVDHAEMGYQCVYSPSIAHTVMNVREPSWPSDNMIGIRMDCDHMKTNIDAGTRRPETWHLPFLCCYASVTNIMVQVAVLEGHKKIYLVGMDLGYDEFGMNHIGKDYGNTNEMPRERRGETEIHMHEIIKRETEKLGIEVLDATINGALEVYQKVDMREVLNSE